MNRFQIITLLYDYTYIELVLSGKQELQSTKHHNAIDSLHIEFI